MKLLEYFTAEEEPRWTRWLLLLLVPLAMLYWVGAWGNSNTFNNTHEASRKNDQKVYIKLAENMKNRGYSERTPRQRTPGYSYLLSLFYSPEKHDPRPELDGDESYSMRWFDRCRELSVWISIACLVGLFLFFRGFLPRIESAFLVAAFACMLYVFRAGYAQPEVLYWSLKLPLLYLMWRMLVKPGWVLGAACGLLAAAAFFVKAGTQPMLLLFTVSFALKLLCDWWRERGALRRYAAQAAQGALVPVLFVAVLSPYLLYSWKQFGDPFYSVYSKYLMWTLPEVEVTTKDGRIVKYVDRRKTRALQDTRAAYEPMTLEEYQRELKRFKEMYDEPYVEPTELPSAARYLRLQTPAQIAARGLQGVERTDVRLKKYYPSSRRFLHLLYYAAAIVAILRWREVLAAIRERPWALFYFTGFFAGYLFLYGWYDALRIGPRLMLGLYPAAVFTLFIFVNHFTRDLVVPIGGQLVKVTRVINLVLIAMLAYLAHRVFTHDLYQYFSGT